jgi:N-acetylglucosaminyldiphosphoundecaprenol N-acetyl-beta-D-mannosaminyltransferase
VLARADGGVKKTFAAVTWGIKVGFEEARIDQNNANGSALHASLHRNFPHGSQALRNANTRSFDVLGVRVDAVQMTDAVEQMRSFIDEEPEFARYVAVTGMHGIAEAQDDPYVRTVLNAADLVVPDGMPLVWVGKFHGYPLRHRVCGSELMNSFCQATGGAYRHFFFGGGPGIAEKLARTLQQKYGIQIAGTYTPPFRPLTPTEEQELAALVEARSADVFWVGLSTPKQEKWMYEHRNKLQVRVMLGVGAAFDMNSGNLRRAPEWMRKSGLEWLFRLACEPRRLWRRYLITIPSAMWFVCLELRTFAARRNKSNGRGAAASFTGERP